MTTESQQVAETNAVLSHVIRRAENAEQHAMWLARQLNTLQSNPSSIAAVGATGESPAYLEFSGYVRLPENAQLDYCGNAAVNKKPASPITVADWRKLPKNNRSDFCMLHEEIMAAILANSYQICWDKVVVTYEEKP